MPCRGRGTDDVDARSGRRSVGADASGAASRGAFEAACKTIQIAEKLVELPLIREAKLPTPHQ